ncbi:unnamed protein product [Cuscuta europaea]|uniref:Uncharacterized protein n=1 Tax=Cuscuta europaea TaxID=41803 RepID=A0A9P1DZI6_CUSEU|nr:unnamed protein product [Cuscuta europaea]
MVIVAGAMHVHGTHNATIVFGGHTTYNQYPVPHGQTFHGQGQQGMALTGAPDVWRQSCDDDDVARRWSGGAPEMVEDGDDDKLQRWLGDTTRQRWMVELGRG